MKKFKFSIPILILITLINFNELIGQTTSSKSCGKCQIEVSINSKIGDTCPHCGVTWGKENSKYQKINIPNNTNYSFEKPYQTITKSHTQSNNSHYRSNKTTTQKNDISEYTLTLDYNYSNANLKREPNGLSDVIYYLESYSTCKFLNHSQGSYVKVDCDGIIGYSNEMYFTNIPKNFNKASETFQRNANLKNSSIDFDGDGVPDVKDKCRTTPGSPSNNGCPIIKAEDRRILNLAVQNVRFETSRATLKNESYPILDQVVDILKRYPDYNVKIRGYTDDRGNAAANQTLSENRARTCANYLISKGIASRRITSQGYGETNPVATNTTSEGRRRNRRVEFDLNLR